MENAGIDLEIRLNKAMSKDSGAAGIDFEDVLRKTISSHCSRKQCRFRPDAIEWLKAQPEWDAFLMKIEEAEIECAEAA
jgi:hypothetical protein